MPVLPERLKTLVPLIQIEDAEAVDVPPTDAAFTVIAWFADKVQLPPVTVKA